MELNFEKFISGIWQSYPYYSNYASQTDTIVPNKN